MECDSERVFKKNFTVLGEDVDKSLMAGFSERTVYILQVWSLAVHNLMYSFPGEHAKASSSLFRSPGSGVAQLYLSSRGHLFSCGADGSLKVRQLAHHAASHQYTATLGSISSR